MPSYEINKIGSDLILKNKYGIYSKNELEYQLIAGHLTVKELSYAYYLTVYQMVHVLRSLGIVFRNSLNNTRVFDATMKPETHQMLLGTLLGDGYMTEPKAYQVAHSVFQMDYLYHKAECLNQFVATVGNRKMKTGESLFLWTYRHDLFKSYFDRFYSHGKIKKYITPESISGLDSRGLAYWYMDDGKYSDYGAYLCVGNITPDEGHCLIEYLKNVFSIEATFQTHNKKKNYYNLYIKAESRDHFFDLINPFVIDSMQYKIKGESPNKNFSENDLIKRHIDLCKKISRPIHYSGRCKNEILIALNDIEDPKTLFIKNIQNNMRLGEQVSSTKFRKIPSEEELKKMFFENKWTDTEVSEFTGYGRNRIASLRKFLNIPSKKGR